MTNDSAVDFATDTRVHIGLEVADRDRSIAFYQVLLGAEPAKVREGYAKFEITEPPLNLSMIENPGTRHGRPRSMHYGIQVKSSDAVRNMTTRLEAAGIPVRTEEQTVCCYASQNKVWASDPDGNPWEVFVVLDADTARGPDTGPTCCADAAVAACCEPGGEDCC